MGKNYYLKDRDILGQTLEHSWGKTADAKAKEKAYNREYYQRHKEEILRKARQAGENIQRTAQNTAERFRPSVEQGLRSAGYNAQSKLYGAAANVGAGRAARQRQRQYGTAVNEAAKASRNSNPARAELSRVRANVEDFVGGIGRKIENAKMATYPGRHPADHAPSIQDVDRYRDAHAMNERLVGDARRRTNEADINQRKAASKSDRLKNAMDSSRSRSADAFSKGDTKSGMDYNNAADQYRKMYNDANTAKIGTDKELARAKAERRRMMNRRAATGAALNEVEKAHRVEDKGAYDIKYDSKLARDLQNTKAKARGAMSKAEKAAQQAREDAKKRMKKWFNR